jgi:hypothetical protein
MGIEMGMGMGMVGDGAGSRTQDAVSIERPARMATVKCCRKYVSNAKLKHGTEWEAPTRQTREPGNCLIRTRSNERKRSNLIGISANRLGNVTLQFSCSVDSVGLVYESGR